MKKLRVAVIGAGLFADQCHLPGLLSHPQCEVVVLCARGQEKAKALAAKYNVPEVISDYHQVLSRDDIDAVTIVTPDNLHCDMAIAAFSAGKHVFCEKPLAMSVDEARKMQEAARKSGLVNMVAFTFRYTRSLQKLRELIHEGFIGRPLNIAMQVYWGDLLAAKTLTWREQAGPSCAGIWADAGSHLFDALNFLFAPAKEVFAQFVIAPRENGFAQADTIDLANALAKVEIPAELHSRLQASNAQNSKVVASRDICVNISASRISRPKSDFHELQVVGTKGILGIPLGRGQKEYMNFLLAGSQHWQSIELPSDAYTDSPLACNRMMQAFVDASLRGHQDLAIDADFEAGLIAQAAIEAGLKSARSAKAEALALEYSLSV